MKIAVIIEQKQRATPAFVVVPAAKVARWKLTGTTTVEASLDGTPLGRRSLKRWDAARWFVELPRTTLAALGKGPGDRATLVLALARPELPAELAALIAGDAAARARWEASSEAQRRMLREHVLAAKTPETRARRARRELLPEPAPAPPRVAGLTTAARELAIRVVARDLPGRTCGAYRDVAVGLDGASFVAADAREATWTTTVEVRDRDGRPAFRGPAVNGPPHERFLYLTWIGRHGDEPAAMFRRAKLRLDAIPAAVLAKALRGGVLVGELGLTAPDGMPLAASVLPPRIRWSSP